MTPSEKKELDDQARKGIEDDQELIKKFMTKYGVRNCRMAKTR